MNIEQIAQRISNPSLCKSEDINALKDLTLKYPYAQTFAILYLKALSANNDIRFDEELLKYAFCITDKAKIYNLVNEKELKSKPQNSSVNYEETLEKEKVLLEAKTEDSPPIIEELTSNETVELESETEEVLKTVDNSIIEMDKVIEKESLPISSNDVSEEISLQNEVLPENTIATENNLQNDSIIEPEDDDTKITFNSTEEILEEVDPIEENKLDSNLSSNLEELYSTIEIDAIPEIIEDDKISENELTNSDLIANLQLESLLDQEEEIKEEEAVKDENIQDTYLILKEDIVKEEDIIEQEITINALNQKYQIEEFSNNSNEDDNTIEDEIEVEKIESEPNNDVKIEAIQEENSTINEKTASLETTNKRAFSSWLKANSQPIDNLDTLNNSEESEAKKEQNISIELGQVDSFSKTEETTPKPSHINEIVETFLTNKPSISKLEKTEVNIERPKKEFYSPIKNAKRSLDESNLPVSETLAKIFAAQGHFPKSIYVYNELMLIYPEKKIFFATKIKELEQKLNT